MQRRAHQMRDGRPFVVRMAMEQDLSSVLTIQRDTIKEGEDYFVRTLPEFDFAIEDAVQKITDLLEQKNSLWLVAEAEGQVIASLDLHGGQLNRLLHFGHFGMVVHPDFRCRGIGRHLVETMLDWVRERGTIKKISTNIFSTNQAARALLRSAGFDLEARLPRQYSVAPNTYRHCIIMSRWID